MSDRIRTEQTLPADFAALLVRMREDNDPRLAMVLNLTKLNGWTHQSMADALGISRQAVQQKIAKAESSVAGRIPDVPLPPRKLQPEAKPPRRRLLVNDELAERLREMQRVASTVNGATPAEAPERQVSVEFSAHLHALVEQGVSMKHLAKVLGVRYNAVRSRLARQGYMSGPPSQSHVQYLGRPSERVAGLQTECKYGHPLSGDNLYVIPKTGVRVCRACHTARGKAYRERKRRAGGAA